MFVQVIHLKRFEKFIKYYFILCAIMEVYLFRHVLITSFHDTRCIYWQAVGFIAYRSTFHLLLPVYIWTFLKIRSSPDEPFFQAPHTRRDMDSLLYIHLQPFRSCRLVFSRRVCRFQRKQYF